VVKEGLTPSAAALVQNLASEQKKVPLLNGRPFADSGPPIGLFHPVFNMFDKGLKSTDPIPLKICTAVRKYREVSTDFYYPDKGRKDAIQTYFPDLFGYELGDFGQRGVLSDGVIATYSAKSHAYALIFEMKNEIGTGCIDPFQQVGRAYQKYWSSTSNI
jgi:hypothetical protein